jgi:hypothetical protein
MSGTTPISPRRQSGAVLLLVLMFVTLAGSFTLLRGLNASSGAIRAHRLQHDAAVLAQAKEALLGYAAAYPDLINPARGPGFLPCPDRNNDGLLLTEGSCSSKSVTAKIVGRLPWRYLGLPDLRDSAGERLWYAVADNYSFHQGGGIYTVPLNSQTPGDLAIDGQGDVAAVIIAPGEPVGSQVRDAANANDVRNYLEGENGKSTTPNDRIFASRASGDFNDRLVAITRAELMAVVEKRVAGTAREALRRYYQASASTPATRYFPYASLLGMEGPHRVGWQGLRRGALPLDPSGDGCECSFLAATSAWSCTCTGGTVRYEFTDSTVTFADDAIPGICKVAGSNSCVCTGTGTDACIVSAAPTQLTVRREGMPAVFTGNSGSCTLPPPAQPQGLTTMCACTGEGACSVRTSQHANNSLSGMPTWFGANDWEQLIYYSLSEQCRAPPDGAGCAGEPQLILGQDQGIGALVAAAGAGLRSTACNGMTRDQVRPTSDSNVCDLLDSEENTDADDTYAPAQRTEQSNDSLRAVLP